MDLESLEEGVDVLGLCILQLLKHLDFVEDFLYAVVPYGAIFFVILGVHIDDLDGHHTVMQEIVAKFCRQHSSKSQQGQRITVGGSFLRLEYTTEGAFTDELKEAELREFKIIPL